MDKILRLRREEIARLRVLRGYRSEAALARKAGLTTQHTNLILKGDTTGNVRLKTVEAFCNALDCEPSDIIERVEA